MFFLLWFAFARMIALALWIGLGADRVRSLEATDSGNARGIRRIRRFTGFDAPGMCAGIGLRQKRPIEKNAFANRVRVKDLP
jgi:hypothetical protein